MLILEASLPCVLSPSILNTEKSCQKPRLNLLVNFVSPLKRLASKAKIYSNLLYDKYMAVEEMPVVLCFQLSFVVFT